MEPATISKGCKIALYDPSGSGGITHYTFSLADGLARAGCRVTIITSEDYELKDFQRSFGIWFLFKKSRLKSWLSAISSFAKIQTTGEAQASHQEVLRPTDGISTNWFMCQLRTLRFTCVLFKAALFLVLDGTRIVHFQWLINRRADLRFMQLLRLLRFKIVYTVHDLLPHDDHTAETRAFYQCLYQYPDKLIVHCENNRKEMLELFSVDRAKLCVIPVGCQNLFFDRFGASLTAARQRLGVPQDKRVILFFGLIKRYKGVEFLLQAFDTINARLDDVMLIIAGKIADDDPDAHRYHSALLAKCSANINIRFRNEYVPFDRVADYFSAADLVVLPYTEASQSAVLLSAYAAGKPVVVTDVGGLGEVVKNGQSGFVVPAKDAQAIAEASMYILTDSCVRERFGVEAKRLGETTYSWTAISRTTAALYDSLVPLAGTATPRTY